MLPESYFGSEEWKNAEASQKYADQAARQGAEFVLFPEGYPGPATGPLEQEELGYNPIDGLRERARKHGVWIAASDIEPNPSIRDTYFLTLKLISPDGKIAARYVRVQPDTPPLNAYLYDGKAHLLPGNDFVVSATKKAKLGLCICSEIFVPEIPRILMLRGANVLFAPVHGLHSSTLCNAAEQRDTWRCVARARAAENLFYVIATQNAYRKREFRYENEVPAGAFIATPERMLASREEPGIMMADLDMDRIDYLRSRNYDEQILSRPSSSDATKIGCRPGQIWERNPELFSELAKPSKYSFDHRYFKEDLDAWIDEYERIYGGRYRALQKQYGKLRFSESAEVAAKKN